MLRSLEHRHQAAAKSLLLHLPEAVTGDCVGTPTTHAFLCVHLLRNRVIGTEELVIIADDVKSGNLSVAAVHRGLPRGREVAVLHAEGGDDPPTDHGAVLAVVEARHGHGAFGLPHDEDAANLHLRCEAAQDPVHLGAPEPENVLVKFLKLFGVLHNRLRLGVVGELSLGCGSVQPQIIPVGRLLGAGDQARHVPVPVLSTSHAVGRDNQVAH
mmetsp:Transcript_144710/g.360744  ORF Transcript_144710/g.360744 Transcript_144710/m.360744 type:complete len:213 (+) Transcript_144710:872-1510(+)